MERRHGSRLVPLRLHVTDADQVTEVARRATDVDLLFNNAGAFEPTELTDAAIVDVARREMEPDGHKSSRRALEQDACLLADGVRRVGPGH